MGGIRMNLNELHDETTGHLQEWSSGGDGAKCGKKGTYLCDGLAVYWRLGLVLSVDQSLIGL